MQAGWDRGGVYAISQDLSVCIYVAMFSKLFWLRGFPVLFLNVDFIPFPLLFIKH